MSSSATLLQTGYVVNRRQDYIWFVGLPFAICLALLSGHYLPGAAIALWITIPYHSVTWLRVHGSPSEFSRFKEHFVLSTILLVAFTYALIQYVPISLVFVVTLWDHQHSLMQQYGFSRVYDFKAKTGAATTAKFDLAFNWIFFGNMLIVSPLFSVIWVRRALRWYTWAPGASLVSMPWFYLGHVACSVRGGYALNSLKYAFLLSSYFLWYLTSFTTAYWLVFGVAHRIMHGIQYIVMVYFYNRHKVERTGGDSAVLRYVSGKGHVKSFLLICAAYALAFHALTEGLVRDFGFGLGGFNTNFDLFSYSLLSSFALLHYYYDAFI